MSVEVNEAGTEAVIRWSSEPGRLYAVNPRYDHICGVRCYPRLDDLPEAVEHVVLALGRRGTPRRLRTCTVILAPGAYDRPLPFPGWTLPGVMTAGAALALVNTHLAAGAAATWLLS